MSSGLAALQRRFLTKERLDEWTRLYVAERNRPLAERAGFHQSAVEADSRTAVERVPRRGWKHELQQNARQALRGFIGRIVIPPGDALPQPSPTLCCAVAIAFAPAMKLLAGS
jgi:hypothetical protein